MTAQQIDYWKLQEQKRANMATEGENERFHRANEVIQNQINAETNRHNLAVESINRWATSVAEKNAAINALNAQTNAKLAGLTEKRDAETARHNAALEGIQATYNEATLALSGKRLDQDLGIATEDRSSREKVNLISSGLGLVGTLGGALTKGLSSSAASKAAATLGGAAAGKAATGATLGTILGAAAIPAAMVLGGTILAGTLAKNNTPYPFNTNGMSPEQFNKEVKYYGAE